MNILIPIAQMRKPWPDLCFGKLTLTLVDGLEEAKGEAGRAGGRPHVD